MDYKAYKKMALKLGLWFGSAVFAYIVIGLILFFTIKINDKKLQLSLSLEFTISAIFIYLLFFCSTLNRIFYRTMITPIYKSYEDGGEEIEFEVNIFTHIFIFLVSGLVFILIISANVQVFKDAGWKWSTLKTLPVTITTFIFSYIFMYLYIYCLNYLLNRNETFKSEILQNIKNKEVTQ